MQVLKLHAVDGSFIDLDESNILYAGNDNEFFWEHNDEAVPEGTAVGIEIPIYKSNGFDDFPYLNSDLDELSALQELAGFDTQCEKFHEERDLLLEEFLDNKIKPDSIQLTLFKNIYLKDDE